MASHEQDDDDADAGRAEDQRDGGTGPTVEAEGTSPADHTAAVPPPSTPPPTEESGVVEDAATAPGPVEGERTADVGNGETYAEALPVADDVAPPPEAVGAEYTPDQWSGEPYGWAPTDAEEAPLVTEGEVEPQEWTAETYDDSSHLDPAIDGDDQAPPEASTAPAAAARPGGRRPGGPRTPAPARARGPAARRSGRLDRPPPAPAPAPAAVPAGNRWMVVLLSVLTVAVIALAIYAVSLNRRDGNQASAPTTTTAETRPVVTLPAGAFTNFRDDETGFSIRYPSAWERYEAPVREIRLLVGDGPYSVRVRSRRTDEATTTQNLANVKAFADGSIAGPTVVVLQQESVSVNGLIGFRYLYTFTDENSGIQGAHLHYFLFQGHKMHDLIFQALPTETFNQIEGVFNQMLESFRSDPEPAGTAPPTTG